MTGFLHAAKAALATELERFRNRRFLDATMAASALVALADGEINITELNIIDQALDTVHELNIYDPHEAVDIYRDYIDGLQKAPAATRGKALDAVAKITGDARAAHILVRVCIAIGKSDEDFSEAEKNTVRDLCRTLDIDPAEFEL
jgi:tellurite resistance protein